MEDNIDEDENHNKTESPEDSEKNVEENTIQNLEVGHIFQSVDGIIELMHVNITKKMLTLIIEESSTQFMQINLQEI